MIEYKEILENNYNYKFKHIISLGHFCSPAMQLKKYYLRDASYPFDWLIFADFKKMLTMLENGFDDLFRIEDYSQGVNNRNHYRLDNYNIRFLHDFNGYQSLEMQFSQFEKKYRKRIARLYSSIKEPTLFIRYCSETDLGYVEKNYNKIDSLIKKFCPENEIIYLLNEDKESKLDVVKVSIKNEELKMSFSFLDDNKELLKFLIEVYDKRSFKNNMIFDKETKRAHFLKKCKEKFLPRYKHTKTYYDFD